MKKYFHAIIATICMLCLISGASWADQKLVTITDVSGAWNFNGTGTINGYGATDVGNFVVSTSGAVGSQVITNVIVSGIITNTTTGEALPYSYSHSNDDPTTYSGSFSVTSNGITITFTETSSTTATLTEKGITQDTGKVIDLTYQAKKETSSNDSGGGGGCSVGFIPMSLLLLLPLGIMLKK